MTGSTCTVLTQFRDNTSERVNEQRRPRVIEAQEYTAKRNRPRIDQLSLLAAYSTVAAAQHFIQAKVERRSAGGYGGRRETNCSSCRWCMRSIKQRLAEIPVFTYERLGGSNLDYVDLFNGNTDQV